MNKSTYFIKKKELKKKLNITTDDELLMYLIQLADLEPVALGLLFSSHIQPEFKNLLGLKLLHNLLSHYLYPQKY